MNNEKEYLISNSNKEKSESQTIQTGENIVDKSVHLQKIVNATAEGQKIERISKDLISEIFVSYIELI